MIDNDGRLFTRAYTRVCFICGATNTDLSHRLDGLYRCLDCDRRYIEKGYDSLLPTEGWCVCGCTYERHYLDPNNKVYCQFCSCRTWATVKENITNDLDINNDPVQHPAHYTQHPSGIECIQITEHMNFCIGNAIKYLWRADLKNGLEDLKKAAWYIEREISRREGHRA